MEELLKNIDSAKVLDANDFAEIVNKALSIYKVGLFDLLEQGNKENIKKISEISNNDKTFIDMYNHFTELFVRMLDDCCDTAKAVILSSLNELVMEYVNETNVEGIA